MTDLMTSDSESAKRDQVEGVGEQVNGGVGVFGSKRNIKLRIVCIHMKKETRGLKLSS